MMLVVLIIHLVICIALVAAILLQRSEGGALGMGGGSGAFMSGRGASDMITRMTSYLAAGFFATTMALTLMAAADRNATVIDELADQPAGEGADALREGLEDVFSGAADDLAPPTLDGTLRGRDDDLAPPSETPGDDADLEAPGEGDSEGEDTP